MRVLRIIPVMALALTSVAFGATAAGADGWHHHHHGQAYTCTGGNVAPGTYSSVTITGVCFMPAGNVVIKGDLTVASGALLDAVTPGDPTAAPLLPAIVDVGGNVKVGQGGVLLLGCSPNNSCNQGITNDVVRGNIFAWNALGVVVHSTTVGGSVTYAGGGSGTGTDVCAGTQTPWTDDPSLANGEGPGVPIPVYSDLEDNVIGGDVHVVGLSSCWLGSLRNVIGGDAVYAHNTMGDPDAMEIANNVVGRSMFCKDNSPAVQYGDGGASPNVVSRHAGGECGFGVVLPNPAPEAMMGTGVPEPISVSARSLGHDHGTHTQDTNVATMPFGTTSTGTSLVGLQNTDTFAGTGLTGSVTEQVLASAYTDGTQSFTALDTCTCSFGGQSGTVTVRAYGHVSKGGDEWGYFLIVSGGLGAGGLATLAGGGTFSSHGQPSGTLGLHEHLLLS